jgi:hypothetical protein
MNVNEVPPYDEGYNPTGCCPRFHPENWEGVELHFDAKRFVRASTVSFFHVPLNMDTVFSHTMKAIQEAHAAGKGFLVLSHDTSAWHGEHLFAVDRDVPGADMITLSGDFVTKVFEGDYAETPKWAEALAREVEERGKKLAEIYWYYTTCPRCAKVYGKNYVVGLARVA